MRIAMLQLNPVVGDITGNTNRLISALKGVTADLIVTPEMSICGYPPRDLLLAKGFVQSCETAIQRIAQEVPDKTFIVCAPRFSAATGRVRNSAHVVQDGEYIAVCDKKLLPSYDVFDEKRYFEEGDSPCIFQLHGETIGILICEDFWRGQDANSAPTYDCNPLQDCIDSKCDIIVSPCASPFVLGKRDGHIKYALELSKKHGMTIVVNNQVGANDDLIFDGGSFITVEKGVLGELPLFEIAYKMFDTASDSITLLKSSPEEQCFRALVSGTRDYFVKTGHKGALLGLSGGIDSALTAVIAVSALGKAALTGVLLPSRYSSKGSIVDAEQLATRLGIATETLPIEPLHQAFERTLQNRCLQTEGIVEENAQARIRGLLLMAMSNERGSLLLATGNKTELAVGYSTLYGDMDGALSVIGDIYKTDVWKMATWLNERYSKIGFTTPPIPESSITKLPSAELRPDQCDQDSLPEYDKLDSILRLHIDFELGAEEIEDELGLPYELVTQVIRMVDRAQFKRDQSAVILKTSPRAFGKGRRMPIVMQRSFVPIRETT